MSSFTIVRFKDIRRMLGECAPGAGIEKKKHRYWVRYGGKTYRGLPLGVTANERTPKSRSDTFAN